MQQSLPFGVCRLALLAVELALVLSVFRVQTDNWIQSAQGVAVHGFDVVNYFETNSAKRGSSEFAVEWQGAVWHFSFQNS